MSDNLVKKLRSQIGDDVQEIYSHEALFRLAANRIEALGWEQTRLHTQCDGLMQSAMNNGQALIIAEARLAKAVEALRTARDWMNCVDFIDGNEEFARDTAMIDATLAEIEGGKNDE